MINENLPAWKNALEKDLGHKGEFFAEAIELSSCLNETRDSLKNLSEWMKPQPAEVPILVFPGDCYIQKEPLGVVLIISPWNYPISLLLVPLIGVIAAGNAAVLKPSEVSPTVSALMAELIPKYLDNEAIQVIEGGPQETTDILKERFDHIIYTGNSMVAKIVMKAASEYLTPVTLELGGKSPCYIDSSVDLDVAVKRVLWGKFMNCGQTCIAPDYLLVHKDSMEKTVEKLKQTIVEFFGKDPQVSKDYSRIINERHAQRLKTLIDSSQKENVEIISGGDAVVEQRYVAPTIIRDVSVDSVLMKDEIFGPILPIVTVNSVDEAIKIINKGEKPLAAYIFTKSDSVAKKMREGTTSGAFLRNDVVVHAGVDSLPFGGVGNSGMGAYHGKFSFDTFSHHKAVVERGTRMDAAQRYPPYDDSKLALFRKLRKITITQRTLYIILITVVVVIVAAIVGSVLGTQLSK
jgi:acyl-CoA reductase-like NAD-dependent aldehyde dehydrogenase